MISETAVTLAIEPGVTLEAWLSTRPNPRGGIAVAHPHPLYGGDMDNPVVVRAVEVASELNFATLRFNFRGVGRSTGAHGRGETEQRDFTSALDQVRRAVPAGAPIVAAGYSFGAMVAAGVAAAASVDALALIAPPLGLGGERRLPAFPAGLPVLIVVGAEDEYCPPPAIERLRAESPGTHIDVVDGANHFFFGKLFPLGEAWRRWLEALGAGQARGRGRAG
jgi:alpha/beta superfamily hydrolase